MPSIWPYYSRWDTDVEILILNLIFCFRWDYEWNQIFFSDDGESTDLAPGLTCWDFRPQAERDSEAERCSVANFLATASLPFQHTPSALWNPKAKKQKISIKNYLGNGSWFMSIKNISPFLLWARSVFYILVAFKVQWHNVGPCQLSSLTLKCPDLRCCALQWGREGLTGATLDNKWRLPARASFQLRQRFEICIFNLLFMHSILMESIHKWEWSKVVHE